MPVGIRCPHCQHAFTPALRPDTRTLACPQCANALKMPRQADPQDPLVGRTIGGFKLLKRLGSGAMAAVYEARPLAGGAHMAIKMLTSEAGADAETVARFRREAELARSLSHPHLVAVAGSGTENGVHWMALELVAGTSLEAAIDARGRLPWTEAAAIALQVGEALAYLGARGVLHRDVKPANVLVAADGSAKLADLGFAKAVSSQPADAAEPGLTAEGMSMGSPAYMAPEQVLDAKAVTHAADVYGLGATLYHAVTGATPFTGRNGYEVMEQVVHQPAPAPRSLVPDLPAGLAAFLEWSLEKEVPRRPPDATSFVRELRAVVAAPDDARRIVALAGRGTRRPRVAALVVGALAAAAVAAAIWWRWR